MVRISTALALAAGALTARAQSNSEINDDVILQYALTLEHLEAAFYSEALQKLSANDFAAGGEQHALFQQIAGHEAAHVALLQSVLGDKATKACNYSFPYSDVQGFKALAQVLEGVGVSAYLGAAQYITNPAYLTAAGSILTIEARHAAWLAATNAENPWPGPNDTPLGFSSVYSLAAGFITSCPDSNPKLPVKAFPTLTASNATNLKASDSITLTLPADFNATSNATYYAAFLNGLTPLFVPYTPNESVKIPAINATGTVYVLIVSSNSSATDENTIAGPAVLHFNAGYPSGIAAGSSTGSGSGAPGTDGKGNPATGGSGSGNGGGSGGDGASSLTTSWIVAAAGAFAALLVAL